MPSSTVHAGFAATATRLINKHGRALVLVKQEASGDAWNPVQSERVAAVVGVQTSFDSTEVDGVVVRGSDKRFLIDSGVTITTDMRLRDYGPSAEVFPLGVWEAGVDAYGGTHEYEALFDYSIIATDEIQPGETSILYKVQARI